MQRQLGPFRLILAFIGIFSMAFSVPHQTETPASSQPMISYSRSVVGLPAEGGLAPGAEADFTLFELEDASVTLPDSSGDSATLEQLFAPRHAILGTRAVKASRLFDPKVHG